jgi:translation initiation factor 2B subunit (eIF-2B alpha/beta/delta family)
MMEGLAMARKLTGAGVPTVVFTDAALMSRITEAGAVWVGGDALGPEGLVNKSGSRALALLAASQGIPFISIMSTAKMLSPEMLPFFWFLPQNPREIAARDTEDLNVVNEYYETVPLDLVNYVFTEEGLSRPAEVVNRVRHEPVSALFAGMAQR